MSITIDDLKKQRRWVLWRLEPGNNGKPTKVPYQPSGYKASLLNPKHLHTYSELEPHVVNFSGVGLALGLVDGVFVAGVDIDNCCDAVTEKFTPESREVVIELNSYSERSPSGTGCHIWCIVDGLPGPGLQKPFPGCKQIEIKGQGYYQTFTDRHLVKTPFALENRQEQVTALYNRVSAMAKTYITVTAPRDEEERFTKLMAGDFSDYQDDKSRADLALCGILARRLNNDIWKITEAWLDSPLYREKLERTDYRSATILKAIKSTVIFDLDEPIGEDAPTVWIIQPLKGRKRPKCLSITHKLSTDDRSQFDVG